MKEPIKFHNNETEKISHKASDVAEYIDAFNVIVWTSGEICVVMTISSGRTEQHLVIGFGELAAVD